MESTFVEKTAGGLAIVCFMVGTGCTTPGTHRVLHQNLQAPNAWPKAPGRVYAVVWRSRAHGRGLRQL